MARHRYLGALPKIGETLWYVATWRAQWVAQLSVSAAALKCGVRDRWIGWDFRSQYGRLKLVANSSRFLILPEGRFPNVGSRVLSCLERRIVADWQTHFGDPLLLLETFVDPQRFHGGVYRAANWIELGLTRGYRRTRAGYSQTAECPKRVFVRPLCGDARARLTHPDRTGLHLTGAAKMMLNTEQMRSLPQCFATIPDPRRAQGRRHHLAVVLGIAAGATLCGLRGYKAITDWAESLGQHARMRFGCRRENGRYVVPSEFVICDCLLRIEPGALDRALNAWDQAWAAQDDAVALDGKTTKNAIDAGGCQDRVGPSKTDRQTSQSAHRPHTRQRGRHRLPVLRYSRETHETMRQARLPLRSGSGGAAWAVLRMGTHARRQTRPSHGLATTSHRPAPCHR